MALPTVMQTLDSSETLDQQWIEKHTDRLIAFEILGRSLRACYHPMDAEELSEKIGQDKGLTHKIITKLRLQHGQERLR